MGETLHSVGIDVGTSTTQLIFSRLTVENRANAYAVPDFTIGDREILYRSPIHFTPLLSATRLDAAGIRQIVAEEYRLAGIEPQLVSTGAIIITGETARKGKRQGRFGQPEGICRGIRSRNRWTGFGKRPGSQRAQAPNGSPPRPAKRCSTWTSAAAPAIWLWWRPDM